MKPEFKIKKTILLLAQKNGDIAFTSSLDTEESVSEHYCMLVEADAHWDYESEFRSGDIETDIPSESSRHYESKSVATKLDDGSWVGWTYWYGGGKHGEPETIDWMEDAYDLAVEETEQLVVVRKFTKVG